MRRGAGIGVGGASGQGDIAGHFDDPLVVDVVQHKIEVSAPGAIAIGDRCSQPYIWVETAEIQSGCFPWRPQIEPIRPPWCYSMWDSRVRRQTAPSVRTQARSNGFDMNALIKPLRPGKPSDLKPSDLKPSDLKPSDVKSPDS